MYDCVPYRFFDVAPDDLVADGVYNSLAIALMGGRHREVSMALLAKELGATKKQRFLSLQKRMSVVSTRIPTPRVTHQTAARPPFRIQRVTFRRLASLGSSRSLHT